MFVLFTSRGRCFLLFASRSRCFVSFTSRGDVSIVYVIRKVFLLFRSRGRCFYCLRDKGGVLCCLRHERCLFYFLAPEGGLFYCLHNERSVFVCFSQKDINLAQNISFKLLAWLIGTRARLPNPAWTNLKSFTEPVMYTTNIWILFDAVIYQSIVKGSAFKKTTQENSP